MTTSQMNKALRGFSKTFAFKALTQFVEEKNTAIALELLGMDLDSPAAKRLQGRPLGMIELLTSITNIPDAGDDEDI